MTYIYALVYQAIIGSGKGLWPARCQAITWTNADLVIWSQQVLAEPVLN